MAKESFVRIYKMIFNRRAYAKQILTEGRERTRPVYEKAEEAKQYIFNISLQDYASNQGRNPSDYNLAQITGHSGSGYALAFLKACALIEMYLSMQKGGFEAVVGLQYEVSDKNWGSEVNATGTGVKLKDNTSSAPPNIQKVKL